MNEIEPYICMTHLHTVVPPNARYFYISHARVVPFGTFMVNSEWLGSVKLAVIMAVVNNRETGINLLTRIFYQEDALRDYDRGYLTLYCSWHTY